MKRNKLLSVLIAGLVFISVPLTSFASSKYVIEPPYKRQETKEIEVSRWAKEVVGISSQLGFLSDTLAKKTSFKLPITREELFVLVNSWGRRLGFATKDSQNKDIYIGSCEATQSEQTRFVRKECYDLSKFQTVFVKTNTCSRAMLTN